MRKVILLLLFLGTTIIGAAQKRITGKVLDQSNSSPLLGATVMVKGAGGATATDLNGLFSIMVSDSAKALLISYAGFESKEVAIFENKSLEVRLEKSSYLNEITIVGSRNPVRTKVETPAAIDIIPISKIINQVGQIDINQLLTYTAPSFQSSRQTISDGTDHVDPAQLRGLGSDQVLVLVNGKRRHQSALVNVNGTVNRGQTVTDLSAIPASAVERIEILRDGAAAQYGSDAIAGVINIVLKKNTEGFSGMVSYGENVSSYIKNYALNKLSGKNPDEKTSVTDGGSFQAALNYGVSLNRKGYLNINGEFTRRDFSNRTGTYTDQIYPSVGGKVRDDSIMTARGTNRNDFDMRIGNSKMTSGSIMLNSQYNLGKNWDLKVFGGYSKKNGDAAGFYRYPNSIFTGAGKYRDQALAKYPEGFLPLIQTDIQDFSISAGVSGKIGLWNASISNTSGINDLAYTVNNSMNYTQFALGPNVQTRFNAGSIRFFQNTINADMSRQFSVLQGLNTAFGAEFRNDQYRQKAGEESSYKNYDTASKAASGAQVFAGFTPQYAGTFNRNVTAFYVDLEQDFTKKFLLTGALRFENYSDFGSTFNYKLAARYKITDKFIVRASTSTGFRAPAVQQKFYAKTNTLFVSTPSGLQPVESGTFPNNSGPAEILGIPELKQETSVNYSAGFTTSPVRGLEISLDAYIINIDNRIVLTNNFTGGNSTALDSLLKASGASQANFFTNAIDTRNKGLEAVVNYNFRVAKNHRFRLTAAATFIKNEVKKGPDGKPLIHGSPELINSGQLGNYFNREDQSRIEVANPASKGNFMIDYTYKRFSANLRFAYFGKVVYLDPTLNVSDTSKWPVNAFTGRKETLDQTFSPKTITDLSASYVLVKQITITIGANNIFDIYEDKQNHSNNVSGGRFIYSRRVQQMGFNGRYLFARLNFNIK